MLYLNKVHLYAIIICLLYTSSKYWDAPGHSEYQLGYSLILLPNEIQPKVNHKEQEKTEAKDVYKRQGTNFITATLRIGDIC